MRAYIYIRFSTLEQRKGDSIARQRRDCLALCERNNWSIETELLDEGRSAYSGKNRESDAALGRFEAEALAGLHVGTVLVCERLDRLSRANPQESYALILSLTQAGVSVATADGNEIYQAGQPLNMVQLLTMFLKAGVAHEESAKKADRIRKAKVRARERARSEGRTITKTVPPWIAVTKTARTAIEERAEIVRRIFHLADAGLGRTSIARQLHREGYLPFNSKSDGWQESFITRTLANRAVLGEFQPTRMDGNRRVPEGEPILTYFPAIVDAALFARVNAGAGGRKAQMGGRKSVKIANLLSGLCKCPRCGGPIRYRERKGEGSARIVAGKTYVRSRPDAFLICSNADRRGGCTNSARLAYASLENALLDAILHLALDDQAFSNRGEVGRVMNLLLEQRRELEISEGRAKQLWLAFADNASPMAQALAESAESSAQAIAERIRGLERQLEEARGRVDNAEHLRRVTDMRRDLYNADLNIRRPIRLKVQAALATLVDRIECDHTGSAVFLKAGAGLLRFDRRGKRQLAIDLVKAGRAYPAELADFLRRRDEANPMFGEAA